MKAKRGEEALMRLLAKSVSAQRDAVYLERDGETVWFPHRGSVAGFHLIHRSGADCRYAFSPARVTSLRAGTQATAAPARHTPTAKRSR